MLRDMLRTGRVMAFRLPSSMSSRFAQSCRNSDVMVVLNGLKMPDKIDSSGFELR